MRAGEAQLKAYLQELKTVPELKEYPWQKVLDLY